MHDVVVIGAGPAGSMVARRLAAAGHDVIALEEHQDVGTPTHCTGLVGLEALREFEIPASLVLGEATSARFWGAAGQSVHVQSDRVRAAVIDRAALDRHLADQARAAGAEIRRGWRAERITVHGTGVRVVNLAGETVEARAAVLACGAHYRFHKVLGLGVPEVFLHSAQVETPFPPAEDVQVEFGRGRAPAGFAWMVPLVRGGVSCARIGLMSETRSHDHFTRFIRSLAARFGVDDRTLPAPRVKMLPLGPVKRTYSDRVVAVGDAAGLVKPTTGGGIYYGLLSGVLASEVLDDALRRDRLGARTLRQYESRWRHRLGHEIRIGLAFRRIVSGLSDESIDALIELGRVNGIVPLLQQHASFDWHRKAAMALLAHPSFRKIVFKSWRESVNFI